MLHVVPGGEVTFGDGRMQRRVTGSGSAHDFHPIRSSLITDVLEGERSKAMAEADSQLRGIARYFLGQNVFSVDKCKKVVKTKTMLLLVFSSSWETWCAGLKHSCMYVPVSRSQSTCLFC